MDGGGDSKSDIKTITAKSRRNKCYDKVAMNPVFRLISVMLCSIAKNLFPDQNINCERSQTS